MRRALIAALEWVSDAADRARFALWSKSVAENGAPKLLALMAALQDADDSLQCADQALDDGDVTEAQRLLALGRASLMDHLEELKGLL